MPSNLGKETLLNLGVGVLIIRYSTGVFLTPHARLSNPREESIALWSCEVNRCSIYISNVFISTDIMFIIMAMTFIVTEGTRPSSGGGNSGDERRAKVVFLHELDSGACCVCCACDRQLVVGGVLPRMDNGYIGATRLWVVALVSWE